jgi:hypothetical protein
MKVGSFVRIAALASLLSLSLAAAAGPNTVDLNAPGALESLRTGNPRHYQAVTRILSEVLAQPQDRVPVWLHTSFGAEDVRFEPILLTSNPPKKRLSFVLEQTSYEALLTLTDFKARAVPAK